MRYIATFIILMLPLCAAALDISVPSINGVSVSESSSVNISNGGSIQSTTKASASTGGNSVGSGGTVKTGNASASSHSSVQSDGGGTTVDIQVETDVNGEKKSESVHKKLSPNEHVSVEVNAKSANGTSSVGVNINGEDVTGDASTTASGDESEDEDEGGFLVSLVASVSTAMGNFFSFFKFW